VNVGAGARKLLLSVHVVSSVGWLGAVVASLAVAVAPLVADDVMSVRSAYVTLEIVGRFVLVPFSLASLMSGFVQSLVTHWGLLRHYWVATKLVINVLAAGVLLSYTTTFAALADRARTMVGSGDVPSVRSASPVVHAIGGVALLAAATLLSVYKPRGLTARGVRHQARSSVRPLA
jgi:hypothetical protein